MDNSVTTHWHGFGSDTLITWNPPSSMPRHSSLNVTCRLRGEPVSVSFGHCPAGLSAPAGTP